MAFSSAHQLTIQHPVSILTRGLVTLCLNSPQLYFKICQVSSKLRIWPISTCCCFSHRHPCFPPHWYKLLTDCYMLNLLLHKEKYIENIILSHSLTLYIKPNCFQMYVYTATKKVYLLTGLLLQCLQLEFIQKTILSVKMQCLTR